MVTSDPAEQVGRGVQAGDGADARQVRILKAVVISLGLLLLIGFGVVIARIAYLATQPGRGIGSATAVQDVNLALPPGAAIRHTAVSGDRMTLHYESPQQSGVVIINLTTGQIVSRISFYPEAPRQ